jgi:hypothetical protein
VGRQQDGRPIPHQIANARQASLLEELVTDEEEFIDQKNIGIGVSGDGKSEPGLHAATVGPDRSVEKLANARECHDLVDTVIDLFVREAAE